jgi:hypothetical protein
MQNNEAPAASFNVTLKLDGSMNKTSPLYKKITNSRLSKRYKTRSLI